MTQHDQQCLGKILWAIADDLRGAMNADDFRNNPTTIFTRSREGAKNETVLHRASNPFFNFQPVNAILNSSFASSRLRVIY